MTILLAAVDTGSLSAASRKLRLPLAKVSRRVAELEKHLKVRLLLRGTRKLVLTEAGRGYVDACRQVIEDIVEAERTAAGEYRSPRGELIIAAPEVIGPDHVVPVVVEFLQAFPEISARVRISERVIDLVEEHVHVAVRIGDLHDNSLIATRIARLRRVLCASPAYLKSRDAPKRPEELASHDCICYEGYAAGSRWEFRDTTQVIQVSSRLTVDSAQAAVIAAVAGAGIARVTSYQIQDHLKTHALVTLLDEFAPAPRTLNFVYPGQRQVPVKLRAFLDFAGPRLRARLGYTRP
jgi:DNA-binding transcriptional LysR family regulator